MADLVGYVLNHKRYRAYHVIEAGLPGNEMHYLEETNLHVRNPDTNEFDKRYIYVIRNSSGATDAGDVESMAEIRAVFERFVPNPSPPPAGRDLHRREVDPKWTVQFILPIIGARRRSNEYEGRCDTARASFNFIRYDDTSLRTKQTLVVYAMWQYNSDRRFWGVTDRSATADAGSGVSFEQMLRVFCGFREQDFRITRPASQASRDFLRDIQKSDEPQQFSSHEEDV